MKHAINAFAVATAILVAGILVLAAAPELASAQTVQAKLALPCAQGFGRFGANPNNYECRTAPIQCPQFPQTTSPLAPISSAGAVRLGYQCAYLGQQRYTTPRCATGFAFSLVPNTNLYRCTTPAIVCPSRGPSLERRTTALGPLHTAQGVRFRYACVYDEPVK